MVEGAGSIGQSLQGLPWQRYWVLLICGSWSNFLACGQVVSMVASSLLDGMINHTAAEARSVIPRRKASSWKQAGSGVRRV